MINKKLIALTISGLMLMPTIAYAKGNSAASSTKGGQIVSEEKVQPKKVDSEIKTSTDTKNIDKKDNQAKMAEKKTQIAAFKAEMKIKHETMKQIKEETITVKKEVQTKSKELKTILKDIQDGKKTLSEEMLTALLAQSEALKLDNKNLKATEDINKDLSETQDKVNKSDFNNALASMDKVIAKFQSRLDALKKLSTDLDAALVIANLATVPAPVDTTVPTETETPTIIK